MNQYSNSASREIVNVFGRSLRWAKHCILCLVDDMVAATIRKPKDNALLFVQDNRTDLYRLNRKCASELVSSSLGPTRFALVEMRENLDRRLKRSMRVRFADDKSVTKQISLPAATQDVLPAIVRNKVESIAPWPLDRAIWGYRTAPSIDVNGQIRVLIKILSRDTVVQLVNDLKESGISVSAVDIGASPTETGTVELDLESDQRKKASHGIAAAIASVCLVLALGYAGYSVLQSFIAQRDVSKIEARVLELRRALVGEKAESEASTRLAEANALFLRKRTSPPLVSVLTSLTELLPDDIWLTQVKVESNTITITGQGKGIPQLIETLENSEKFENANFASATQRDGEVDSERFSISAAIRLMESDE